MNKWNLFWSPEGRQIATVEAQTRRAAIRKAPLPYRKYLGEIYAEATNPNAWYAVVRLLSHGLLLGGGRSHISSEFSTEQAARDFARQCVEVNKNRPGFESAQITWEVVGTYSDNPVQA